MMNKIFTTILIIAFMATSVFAQNVPTNPLQPAQSNVIYVIDNFSPLLNGHASAYTLTSGQAIDAYNVRGNDEYSSLAKRPALNAYGTCSHSSPVTGLYRFYQSTGTKYTITSSATYLDYISDTGSCTNLLAGLSNGARWNFSTYKDQLIATDGIDQPQKWDGVIQTTADTTGSRSVGYLTTQLGAPFAQLAAGTGLTASKWYHYVVAYWDGTNYWYSTAQSNPLQMGASTNKQVSLTGVPLGPATTLSRFIFRTKADNTAALSQTDTTYYYLTTLNDNITTTYTDSTADSSLGGTAGAVLSATVNNIGLGYVASDTLTLSQTGGSSGTLTVNTIYSTGSNVGTITSVSIDAAGSGYTSASNVQVTGGSGTGATFNITTTPTWAVITSNNSSAFGGLNVTPPHGTFPFINQGYFWLADDQSGTQYGQSTAYFSAVNDPDYFLSTNYFLIRPDDGDAITFINSYLGYLTIGKTNTISKIYTQAASPTSWSVSQPFSFLGCISPYSAVSTPLGILYLGRYGIYQFNGQSSTLMSDVVTNDINDIAQFNLPNVVATTYKNEYRMAYTSSASGSSTNNIVLIYDMIRNNYVKDTENINAWAVFNSSSDFGGLYSGSSNADGYILAHSTQPTILTTRYLTDLNAGTFSATGTFGTQNNPTLSLSLPTWANWSTEWNSMGSSTWIATSSPGTWTSPILQINANALYELYWNSVLPAGTSATIAIRTASTSAGISSATWSSEFSNPAGSSLSGVNANNYIQERVTLSTNNLGVTPYLYVQNNYMIQLIYSQNGTAYETSVPSTWESGWLDLVTSPYLFYMSNLPKIVKEIDVYYEGTAGTITVGMKNLKGDSAISFNINLAQSAPNPPNYWGGGSTQTIGSYGPYKMYQWSAGLNDSNTPTTSQPLNGDRFMLNISESGTTPWRIQRIAIVYDTANYVKYGAS